METSGYQSLNDDSNAPGWGELNHQEGWGNQQPESDILGSNPYGNSGYSETADSGTANNALGAAYSSVGQRNPYEVGGNLFEADIYDNPYTESPADPNSQQSRRGGYGKYRPTAQDYGDDDQLILGG